MNLSKLRSLPHRAPYKRAYPSGRAVWIARDYDFDGVVHYAKPDWNGGKSSFKLWRDAQAAIGEVLRELHGAPPGGGARARTRPLRFAERRDGSSDKWLAISENGNSWIEQRPAPLQLMPVGLKGPEKLLIDEPFGQGTDNDRERRDVLADALIQPAQPRRGSDGAALSDIWTVVEAIFAGDAGEPRLLAGDLMVELLEYLYPLHLLEWMGERLVGAGVDKAESALEGAAWTREQFEGNAKAGRVSGGFEIGGVARAT